MIPPIVCYSCSKPLSEPYKDYIKRMQKGEDSKKILDSLNLKRYCCRSVIISTVDISPLLPFLISGHPTSSAS